jgi:hypothetical protein
MLNNNELKIIELIKNDSEKFVIPLQVADILNNNFSTREEIKEILNILYGMINKGLLRKRNCEGLAFELNN